MIELLAVAALLTQDSRTVCDRNAAGQIVCRTTEADSDSERCAGRDWLLAGCTTGERDAARARQEAREAREAVFALLADGDCDSAVTAALRLNDLAFAREVRDFCAPAE